MFFLMSAVGKNTAAGCSCSDTPKSINQIAHDIHMECSCIDIASGMLCMPSTMLYNAQEQLQAYNYTSCMKLLKFDVST